MPIVELTIEELRHLRFILGGPASFNDIKRMWNSQKYLHPIFDKLIAAEKHIVEPAENRDEIAGPPNEPGQSPGNH